MMKQKKKTKIVTFLFTIFKITQITIRFEVSFQSTIGFESILLLSLQIN